jgi:hypothetical protein
MNRRNSVLLGYNAALLLIFGMAMWFILPTNRLRLLVIVLVAIALLLVSDYQVWRVRQRSEVSEPVPNAQAIGGWRSRHNSWTERPRFLRRQKDLGCLLIILALPGLFVMGNVLTSLNEGILTPTTHPVAIGASVAATTVTFLPPGEAAYGGPGYSVMDFDGHFWTPPFPSRITQLHRAACLSEVCTGDSVRLQADGTATFRWSDGETVTYARTDDLVLKGLNGSGGLVFGLILMFYMAVGGLGLLPLLFFVGIRVSWWIPAVVLTLFAVACAVGGVVLDTLAFNSIPPGLIILFCAGLCVPTIVTAVLSRSNRTSITAAGP